MIDIKKLEVWFITGSQDLYGPEVLKTVGVHSQEIAKFFNNSAKIPVTIVYKSVMRSLDEVTNICVEANSAKQCIGVITWCHTFSPSKMWINGLKILNKPLLQLHTQYNRDLPWKEIDMDFMNLNQAAHGDREALTRLFDRHRPYLRRVAAGRLNPRMRPRVDPSDVVQETQAEAAIQIEDYFSRRPMPFRLWLLRTLSERLRKLHRLHMATAKRSVEREVPLPGRSSLQFARFFASNSNPSTQLSRKDLAQHVRRLLARLSDEDREVLLLRNFDGISNEEIASLLEITPESAKKRHARALLRLKAMWREMGPESQS